MARLCRYGCRRDSSGEDARPFSGSPIGSLPPVVDLRDLCTQVEDQGEALQICTPFAVIGALSFLEKKSGNGPVKLSPLFLYFNARVLEGHAKDDWGVEIRNALKSAGPHGDGVCSAELWPYVEQRWDQRPQMQCYTEAQHHRVASYEHLSQTKDELFTCLASGLPFLFNFDVWESGKLESPQVSETGFVPLPSAEEREQPALFLHAVMAVGYDDGPQELLFRNSLGIEWGKEGYGRLPYEYVLDPALAHDFWVVRGA